MPQHHQSSLAELAQVMQMLDGHHEQPRDNQWHYLAQVMQQQQNAATQDYHNRLLQREIAKDAAEQAYKQQLMQHEQEQIDAALFHNGMATGMPFEQASRFLPERVKGAMAAEAAKLHQAQMPIAQDIAASVFNSPDTLPKGVTPMDMLNTKLTMAKIRPMDVLNDIDFSKLNPYPGYQAPATPNPADYNPQSVGAKIGSSLPQIGAAPISAVGAIGSGLSNALDFFQNILSGATGGKVPEAPSTEEKKKYQDALDSMGATFDPFSGSYTFPLQRQPEV